MCGEVIERPRPWGPATSPLSHGTIGRRDKTAPDLRRKAVKQAIQGDCFLDGYSGAGGERGSAGMLYDFRWMTPLLFTTPFCALPLGHSSASRTARRLLLVRVAAWLQFESMVLPHPHRGEGGLSPFERCTSVGVPR